MAPHYKISVNESKASALNPGVRCVEESKYQQRLTTVLVEYRQISLLVPYHKTVYFQLQIKS
jgi:hypothetical protein